MALFTPITTASEPGGSTVLDRIQGLLKRAFDTLQNAVTNDHVVTITLRPGTTTKAYHALGYSPRTWEVVNRKSASHVWEPSDLNPHRSTYVLLVTDSEGSEDVEIRFT